MSVDPLAEKYPGWSPYNYGLGNPLRFIDPNRQFPVEKHAEVQSRVYGTPYWQEWVGAASSDGFGYYTESIHFDNYASFNAIQERITNAGGFLEIADHTIGDFYSHSNFVDLWLQTDDGKAGKQMPTFEEVDWNSEFGKTLTNKLQTTAYPDSKDPKKGHDHGTEFGGFSSKDVEKKGYEKQHKLALEGYERSLQHKAVIQAAKRTGREKRSQADMDEYDSHIP